MRHSLGKCVLALVLLIGCGDGDRFVLKVTFPDAAARSLARNLRVVAIGPSEGYGCDELKQGQAVPGDPGYAVESEVSFDWPATGEIRGLEDVSTGRKLFYAEAKDENEEVILRGCTQAQVGEEESRQVTIALEWVSQPCQVDGDCDDSNECTTDRCEDGQCVSPPVADGTGCGSRICVGLIWMQPTCVSGECSGSEIAADCEDSNDCTRDSCDDLDGCVNLPLMAGTDCGICAACDGQGICIDDLTQDGDCPLCQECRPAGTCMYQAAGSDVKGECANETFCDGAESCDGSGRCQAGGDPCPGLNCNEDSDTCEGCLLDADCPLCQECDAGDCVDQAAGSDSKDDCAADACNTGTCDGAGACGLEAAGTDCGVCSACDGLGMCIRDLTQDQDCPVCQECEAAGSCVNQAVGAACDDGDSCSSLDACDGVGACVPGATDKDTDGDSYYDDACPGGDDCDDDAISVNPGATEGPIGDATCSDGADNDCDGVSDADDSECSDWWDTAFRSRIKLTFGNSARGDLLNFPVRVSLDSSRIDYLKTQDAGQDLRFIETDGSTVLAHEIEIWDETGTSEVWVRVPQIDASDADFIWLYFDNDTAGDGQSLTTWDPDHVGVWHFGDIDGGSGAVSDSTSSGNAGTVFNGAIFESAGKIGKAIVFDGLDDYAILGNTGFNPSSGTVEVWVNVDVLPAANRSYIFSHFTPAPVSNRAYIYVQPDQLWGTGMGSEFNLVQGSAIVEDDWHYLALTWDGVDVRGYLNGSLDFGPTPYADLATAGDIWVGSWDSTDEFTNGTIDEIRISSRNQPVDWISAQYSSMMDAFVTFGSVEAAP